MKRYLLVAFLICILPVIAFSGRSHPSGVACYCSPWEVAPGVYEECLPNPGEGPMPECGPGYSVDLPSVALLGSLLILARRLKRR